MEMYRYVRSKTNALSNLDLNQFGTDFTLLVIVIDIGKNNITLLHCKEKVILLLPQCSLVNRYYFVKSFYYKIQDKNIFLIYKTTRIKNSFSSLKLCDKFTCFDVKFIKLSRLAKSSFLVSSTFNYSIAFPPKYSFSFV